MKVSDKIYLNVGNQNIISLIVEKNSKILDIGCGVGDNARILRDNNHTTDGITLSEEEKKLASRFCENVYIFNLENGLPIEVKNSNYDYIICSHVLEHIAFPEKLMKDLQELTFHKKTNVLIALPNVMYYKTRLNILFGNFDYTYDGIMNYTHLRWYTMKSAKSLFENNNFVIRNSYVDGLPPMYGILKKLGSKPIEIIKGSLFKLAPTVFGSELIFELIQASQNE